MVSDGRRRRRRQQYGRGSIDGGGRGGSRFSIGHRGTFCQDFTDDLLSTGAAAAARAASGAGRVAVWDVLAAVRVDYVHDTRACRRRRRTRQDPTTAGSCVVTVDLDPKSVGESRTQDAVLRQEVEPE